tara:strand:+ start:1144 stop:1611 length:468 start_codon:yes stop_codon:yes gene_type:complete
VPIKLTDIYDAFGELSVVDMKGRIVSVDYEELKKFDLDLEFGKIGEDFTQSLFTDNTMVEVKTERDIWKNTGNIAIEIRCNGKPSGISTTGSENWVHLLSYDGEIVGGFIFKRDLLRQKIKDLLEQKKARIVMGGDFDASQMVLKPIKELFSNGG